MKPISQFRSIARARAAESTDVADGLAPFGYLLAAATLAAATIAATLVLNDVQPVSETTAVAQVGQDVGQDLAR